MRGLTSATGASSELVIGHGRGLSSLRAATAGDARRRARAVFLARLFVASAGLGNDQRVDARGAERQQGDDDCEGEPPHAASVACRLCQNGTINWVQIDLGDDAKDADHYISPEERLRVATARQ